MAKASGSYHHGDLRAACLRAARELLEEDGGGLSLRAVARRAGVSATAPYRHFPDREALVSAVAAQGYRELAERLATAHPAPATPEDLADVAVAYVQFALAHPALFRAMFSEPCDPGDAERAAATAAISAYVDGLVRRAFPEHGIEAGPGADVEALSTAVWALVHGLAFLHLDGKLDASAPEVVADRVRAAVHANLGVAAQRARTE
ncbi:TetR/AcrR family transcriptional regulator [Streptomyces sp. 4503]|uniref:TetR/AcrR family transcriptional regulator n=1 Tax=Streptomyces niphimycinicus TaxID=2842201 RepID=A0ABS6C765_9ACTN|nr:TetR/AcrR family transcriptional regulator [Streptomyces niphimycinicus]MBU3862729.1 TetR/AcrR family transcriptional regulator [Streptomyces niphimycinicus]